MFYFIFTMSNEFIWSTSEFICILEDFGSDYIFNFLDKMVICPIFVLQKTE